MAENDYFTLSEPEKSWLITQYDSVRNEIAGRASNHHAMFSWAAAIVAAVTVFAPNALQEWDKGKKGLVIGIGLAVALVVLGAIIAALLSVRHTRRLGAYARAIEERINLTVLQRADNALLGWEIHYNNRAWETDVWKRATQGREKAWNVLLEGGRETGTQPAAGAR